MVPAAVAVAKAAAARHGLKVDWRPMPIGRRALDTHGSTMPDGTLEALAAMDGWILGPIGHRDYPKGPGAINPHPILRKHFNLFANVRPTRSYPGIGCVYDDIDLIIVRENNEGFQPDRNVIAGSGEFRPNDDLTISVRVISRVGSRRVARAALELARHRRKRCTFVHKNTVFKLGCGMFVEECYKAAEEYPDVAVDEVIVDTMAMRLVRDPQSFDVIVTTNMFGDILTDEAAGLVGGLGMAPGLCIGDGNIAMAQATHGSAPDIAGKGLANPYAMIEFDAHAARLARARPQSAAGGGGRRLHGPGDDGGAHRPGRAHGRHPRHRHDREHDGRHHPRHRGGRAARLRVTSSPLGTAPALGR